MVSIDGWERDRRLEVVRGIACSMAASEGLIDSKRATILSKYESRGVPILAEALDAQMPEAKQSDGGRYFAHVRNDGRGQIMIKWPDGTEVIIKFLILEKAHKPRTGDADPMLPESRDMCKVSTAPATSTSASSVKFKVIAAGVLALAMFPPVRYGQKVGLRWIFGEEASYGSVAVGHFMVLATAWGLMVWLLAARPWPQDGKMWNITKSALRWWFTPERDSDKARNEEYAKNARWHEDIEIEIRQTQESGLKERVKTLEKIRSLARSQAEANEIDWLSRWGFLVFRWVIAALAVFQLGFAVAGMLQSR